MKSVYDKEPMRCHRGFAGPGVCCALVVLGLAGYLLAGLMPANGGSGTEAVPAQQAKIALGARSGERRSRAIEEVRAGDWVLARDQNNADSPITPRRVARTFRRTTDHLRVLQVVDALGIRQELRTTNEHPF